MQRLIINGGKKLCGEIRIQGAKNSALPLLAGTLLVGKGSCEIKNVPGLSDVYSACRILNSLGCRCRWEKGTVRADGTELGGFEVREELMRTMRGSIVFMGPLLGRLRRCRLTFPGGCPLGSRPIDLHLSALRKMGVSIREEHGVLDCSCPGGLKGADISLSFPSVGATENIMLSAVLAEGETVIRNAAREPEIEDLAGFLNLCGADVSGAGSGTVHIKGVKELCGCTYEVMPDRIAAATYMAAAAVTGGELALRQIRCGDLRAVINVFEQMGCDIYCQGGEGEGGTLFISGKKPLKSVEPVRTMPYPGFPTDAQAIVMAALTLAEGSSMIIENIFENRYLHVDELVRMGADIRAEGKVAVIKGVKELYGAKVRAADLRGGAALAVAALAAEGTTEIEGLHLIDRGYEEFEKKLSAVGADIVRE